MLSMLVQTAKSHLLLDECAVYLRIIHRPQFRFRCKNLKPVASFSLFHPYLGRHA